MSLDIKILEIYGMSEITGPQTGNDYENYRYVIQTLSFSWATPPS